MLTAVGTTASGQSVESETILLDVERPDLPISLAALLSSFSFQSFGEQVPIVLTAKFSDGSILDVTESSYVTYVSSNTAVAAVNRHGVVTAVGAGEHYGDSDLCDGRTAGANRDPGHRPLAKVDGNACDPHFRQSECRQRQYAAADHAIEHERLTDISAQHSPDHGLRGDG